MNNFILIIDLSICEVVQINHIIQNIEFIIVILFKKNALYVGLLHTRKVIHFQFFDHSCKVQQYILPQNVFISFSEICVEVFY